jgi:O-antigen/teichoic acid export membrane protein
MRKDDLKAAFRLLSSPKVSGVVFTTSRLLMARMGYAVAVLFSSTLAARFLGVEDFGRLSLAQTLLTVLSPLVFFGLQPIVSTALVTKPDSLLVWTAIRFQVSVAFILVLGVAVAMLYLGGIFGLPFWLVMVVLLGLFTLPFDMIEGFFLAKECPEREAYSRLGARICLVGCQLGVGFGGGGLALFALLVLFEKIIQAGLHLWQGMKVGFRIEPSAYDADLLKRVLRRSWPLLLSSLSIVAFSRLGELALGILMSPAAVAQFAVASRLAEALAMLPTALVAVLVPWLVRSHDKEGFFDVLDRVLSIVIYLSAASAIGLYLLAPYIVKILFGEGFEDAVTPLRLLVWNVILIGSGLVRGRFQVLENDTVHVLVQTSLGFALGVILNCFLIPSHGILGAAIAVLGARVFLSYGTTLIFPSQWTFLMSFHRAIVLPAVLTLRFLRR